MANTSLSASVFADFIKEDAEKVSFEKTFDIIEMARRRDEDEEEDDDGWDDEDNEEDWDDDEDDEDNY